MPTIIELFSNKRMMVVLLLGFASGLPLGLTGSALQAWYSQAGVDITTIGFITLVGQPYVYKFFWAPFMDKVALPFGGRRRSWLYVTQLLIMLLLGVMAPNHPRKVSSAFSAYSSFISICFCLTRYCHRCLSN